MIGDEDDMVRRLKAVLPTRWFSEDSPLLDGLLHGLASSWTWLYDLLLRVSEQARVATATGIWLDMIARDFFDIHLVRRGMQSDLAFRNSIKRDMLRERGTRNSIITVLQDLTGRTPIVFEPTRPVDTAAWGIGGGYALAGAWGNLNLPFQCFVIAYRPHGSGIAQVAGWGFPAGGYGFGAVEYANMAMVQGQVTDAEINSAVASVMPAAVVAWMRITN